MTHRLILLAAACAAAGIAVAQTPPATAPALAESEAARAEVIERLAGALDENFVFPDVARRYAAALRAKASAGGYAGLGDDFAAAVTADLQAVHPDRHLRIGRAGAAPSGAGPRMRMPDPSEAIGRSGWIADGVAYLELGLFPGTSDVVERIERFLDEHRDARAVIFDIRGHRGGGLAEMDAIFARLFAVETPLLTMDTRVAVDRRGRAPIRDGATVRPTGGPDGVVRRIHYAVPGAATPLRRAQVFVLTSRRTGSAAEHFALALKRTGRAALIGEPTGGAGHYGGMVDLGHGYSAFIPVGRTFDPDTDRGWEGTGVAPDIEIPADQALDEALRRAGADPARRRPLA